MSSGSRQTIFGVAILIACVVYASVLAVRHVAAAPSGRRGTVHLVVPPPAVTPQPAADPHVLRVCADPNNLPFSDRDGRGFENRIAELVARDLGRRVEYYWQPQRRGFIRTTLNARRCDVVIGLPASSDMVRVTRPYYRSSYVFVTRQRRHLTISSFDDPRLRHMRIGIPITGDDYENPPAAQALANRHILDNVRGYTVYGDYSMPHPSWGVLDAVVHDDVDVAIEWGPLAGYFARRAGAGVDISAVRAPADRGLAFAFDIAMGVRHKDAALAAMLDRVIERRARDIREILTSYGVPLAPVREGVKG